VLHGNLKSIIENVTDENAEYSYNKFFNLALEVLRTEDDVVEAIVQIRQRMWASDSPVLKSYALLLIASAVDAIAKIETSNSEISSLVPFLISEVSNLIDFRNFDDQGNFIHFVSHLAYLGHALSDANLLTKSDAAILAREVSLMYSRSKAVYFLNEPLVVGQLMLMLCTGQPDVLKSALEDFQIDKAEQELGMAQGDIFRANYDYLCMGICLMNAKYEIVSDAPIQSFVDKMLERIHG
jgi:hypothetical protein